MNNYLEKFEFIKMFFPPYFIETLNEESYLYMTLKDDDTRVDKFRQSLDECLEIAYRYNLVDADLEGKLKKGDWESYQATINELKVFKYLEDTFGIGTLHWHPQGRKGKIGEFELNLSELKLPIFIEVKTIFPKGKEKLEKRLREKLRLFSEQVPIPTFLDIQILKLGDTENFHGYNFKRYLCEQLSKISVKEIKVEALELPDYEDSTGVLLKIGVLPIQPVPKQNNCHVGILSGEPRFSNSKKYLVHSLKKAYDQIPKGKQPCLVILCSSTEFPINEHTMLDTLLGTLALRVYQFINRTDKVPEPKPFRKLDGFPQPKYNRHLSAIAVYKEKFDEKTLEKTLKVYHNPWAINPIDKSIFKGHNIKQLVDQDGYMKWIS